MDEEPSRRRRRTPALILLVGAVLWGVRRVRLRRPAAGPPAVLPRPAAPAPPVVTPRQVPAPPPSVGVAARPDAPRPDAEPAPGDGPYGPGSARSLPDGAPPGPEYTIKGNANSMLFHPPSSPYFGRTRAEVWFRSAEDALAAGFTEYARRRRS